MVMLHQQQQQNKSYCLLLVRFRHRPRAGSLLLMSSSGIQAEGAVTTSNISSCSYSRSLIWNDMSFLLPAHWPGLFVWPNPTLRELRHEILPYTWKPKHRKTLGNNTYDHHSALFWLANIWHIFPPTGKVLSCHPMGDKPKIPGRHSLSHRLEV